MITEDLLVTGLPEFLGLVLAKDLIHLVINYAVENTIRFKEKGTLRGNAQSRGRLVTAYPVPGGQNLVVSTEEEIREGVGYVLSLQPQSDGYNPFNATWLQCVSRLYDPVSFFVSQSHRLIHIDASGFRSAFNLKKGMDCFSGKWNEEWNQRDYEYVKKAPGQFVKVACSEILESDHYTSFFIDNLYCLQVSFSNASVRCSYLPIKDVICARFALLPKHGIFVLTAINQVQQLQTLADVQARAFFPPTLWSFSVALPEENAGPALRIAGRDTLLAVCYEAGMVALYDFSSCSWGETPVLRRILKLGEKECLDTSKKLNDMVLAYERLVLTFDMEILIYEVSLWLHRWETERPVPPLEVSLAKRKTRKKRKAFID